jgi:cation:H+ antiporter
MTSQIPSDIPLRNAVTWLIVGLVLLLISSRLLVWGGVNIAEALGVSDLVIGLTVVAIGTSLPELAAAIASALKNEHDLIIGNVIGSNLFNTLAVLGLPALIAPGLVPPEVVSRDLPVMGALTLLLVLVAMHRPGGEGRINRLEGLLLVSCFLAYEGYLFATL